ncbi:unnamed protein product [Trichogramma brassicae]|uniref:Uncharacterized protein n=1 Tax=Trichogramma brassicae TaxID=86971 RepID=A0A6H5IXE3_9HYME|nr:unnamed protein product [Trichogramma brassicae]
MARCTPVGPPNHSGHSIPPRSRVNARARAQTKIILGAPYARYPSCACGSRVCISRPSGCVQLVSWGTGLPREIIGISTCRTKTE